MPYDHAVQPPSRRRSWLIVVPAALLLAIALVWCGVWFYAASRTQTAMTGWLDREARLGRIYTCGSHAVGGFPFRIEVRCDNAAAELRALQPPLAIAAPGVLVAAQVWQPTLLISEFTGPLRIGDANAAPELLVNWSSCAGQRAGKSAPAGADIHRHE